MTKKFKLKNMSFTDTADIELFDPADDEPLLCADGKTVQSVTVYGPESDEFKQAETEMLEVQIGKKGIKELSPAQILTARRKMLVKITKSYNGVDFGDGNGLLDVKNANEHYKKVKWFRKQIDEGAGDYANFS